MANIEFDIIKIMNILSDKRKIFHSEADFQFAFAWEIQKEYNNSQIRLEYPMKLNNKTIAIDVLIILDGKVIPIELKYKTKNCNEKINNEEFILKNHGAQDLGMYDFWADVQRVEKIPEVLPNYFIGYTIWLTNDQRYWKQSKINSQCLMFNTHNQTTKKDVCLEWIGIPAKGTITGRENPISLKYSYEILWKDFSNFERNNFKYVVLNINKII